MVPTLTDKINCVVAHGVEEGTRSLQGDGRPPGKPPRKDEGPLVALLQVQNQGRLQSFVDEDLVLEIREVSEVNIACCWVAVALYCAENQV